MEKSRLIMPKERTDIISNKTMEILLSIFSIPESNQKVKSIIWSN